MVTMKLQDQNLQVVLWWTILLKSGNFNVVCNEMVSRMSGGQEGGGGGSKRLKNTWPCTLKKRWESDHSEKRGYNRVYWDPIKLVTASWPYEYICISITYDHCTDMRTNINYQWREIRPLLRSIAENDRCHISKRCEVFHGRC